MVKYFLRPDPEKKEFNKTLVVLFFGKGTKDQFPDKGFDQTFEDIKEDLWRNLDATPLTTGNKKLEPTSNKIESSDSKWLSIEKTKMKAKTNEEMKRNEWKHVTVKSYKNDNELATRIQIIMTNKHKRKEFEDIFEDFRYFGVEERHIKEWLSLEKKSNTIAGRTNFLTFNYDTIKNYFVPKLKK